MIGPLIKSMILKFCPLGTIYFCSHFPNISILRNLPLIFELEKKCKALKPEIQSQLDRLCTDVSYKLLKS